VLLALAPAMAGCTHHTVEVQAPKDPIVINLNVKIKVEKDVEDLLQDNPNLF
jgi:YnbE-like lipoprotein